MENEKIIYQQNATLKSILKNSSFPIFVLMALILIGLQALIIFRYGYDLNTFIIEVVILGGGIIVFTGIITYRIKKYTFVIAYESYLEISDVSRTTARLSKIKYEDIKSVEIKKNVLIIESVEKFKILHLENPYGLEEIINKKRKEFKIESQ